MRHTNLTLGPFDGEKSFCRVGIFLADGYTCSTCPAGTFQLRSSNNLSEASQPWQCKPCASEKKCKRGSFWEQCSTHVDGFCATCGDSLPPNAEYHHECQWKCHAGFFARGNRCLACDMQSQQICLPGYLKSCLSEGVAGCLPCANPLPPHAEWAGTGSADFPHACPWRCLPGFWYNRSAQACAQCTSYKPTNAHFVSPKSDSQVCMSSSSSSRHIAISKLGRPVRSSPELKDVHGSGVRRWDMPVSVRYVLRASTSPLQVGWRVAGSVRRLLHKLRTQSWMVPERFIFWRAFRFCCRSACPVTAAEMIIHACMIS